MSATDELRRMLDERGVEWVDTGDGSTLIPAQTATNVAWDVNTWPSSKDTGDCLWVQNRHPLTPEQAIAATLGGGTLTAEQVREAIERNFGKVAVLDDGGPVEWRDDWVCKVGINYRAIADELNARTERTCHIEMYPMGLHEEDGEAPICSACRVAIDEDVYFCPNCGARVIGGNE